MPATRVEPDAKNRSRGRPRRLPAHDVRELELLNEIARIASRDLALQPMLQRITDALASLFGWEFVACVRIDTAAACFVCEAVTSNVPTAVHPGYRRPLGSGIVGEVAATGRPILIDDVHQAANYVETLPGALSELCVPVLHRDRVTAILNLESTRLGAFHDQLPLLEMVAEQVAGAIDNARLHELLRQRAADLEVLAEASRTALEAEDLQALLDRVVGFVRARFGLSIVSLLLAEDDGFVLRAMASSRPFPGADVGDRWPPGVGVIGRAIRTGTTQIVLDPANDPDYVVGLEEMACQLVAPIRWAGRPLGFLSVEAATLEALAPETRTVLLLLADQVAGAIRLARLNRELEDASVRLTDANRRLAEANAALQRLSELDGLTGVANRRHFDARLEQEWRRATRGKGTLALILVDVDCFKAFNDVRGHLAGDDCIRRVASALAALTRRAGELVARYGGEEFALVLPGMDEARARDRGEEVRASIEALALPHPRSTAAAVVTISAGVASAEPRRGASPSELVAAADRALYRAKRDGRNRVVSARS